MRITYQTDMANSGVDPDAANLIRSPGARTVIWITSGGKRSKGLAGCRDDRKSPGRWSVYQCEPSHIHGPSSGLSFNHQSAIRRNSED